MIPVLEKSLLEGFFFNIKDKWWELKQMNFRDLSL